VFKEQSKEAGIPLREFFVKDGECWKDVNARAMDFLVNEIINKHLFVSAEEE